MEARIRWQVGAERIVLTFWVGATNPFAGCKTACNNKAQHFPPPPRESPKIREFVSLFVGRTLEVFVGPLLENALGEVDAGGSVRGRPGKEHLHVDLRRHPVANLVGDALKQGAHTGVVAVVPRDDPHLSQTASIRVLGKTSVDIPPPTPSPPPPMIGMLEWVES
eukprot:816513-Prorocentrum_minimum.AAC.1